jgi:hypothetical protein
MTRPALSADELLPMIRAFEAGLARHPESLAELEARWDSEADRGHLDSRHFAPERLQPRLAMLMLALFTRGPRFGVLEGRAALDDLSWRIPRPLTGLALRALLACAAALGRLHGERVAELDRPFSDRGSFARSVLRLLQASQRGPFQDPDLAATRARLECAATLLPEPVHPALLAILAVSVATAEESADRDVVQHLEHALVVGAAILAAAYSSKN